ncbi:MAG: hypothetical protein KAW12_30465 [Candidatus Aminicenantes bacterium]|nr:hypothetical protein [Candidatus Aminicenantes bacterium]
MQTFTITKFVEFKKNEIEKQQILNGLKEAVDDVKNNRVSKIDTLWESIEA